MTDPKTQDAPHCDQESASRGAVGRPRDPAKHDAILTAAREAFFSRGFNAATIEDIAQRANVSKVTVYKQFTDKETLFEATVKAEMMRMSGANVPPPATDAEFRERLNAYGLDLLCFLFHPDHVALDRILAPELSQMPVLARRFFEAGPGQCRARLAQMLATATKRGMIHVSEPDVAAETLLAMWKGLLDVELRFQMIDHLTVDELKHRVDRGTGMFLKLFACDAKR